VGNIINSYKDFINRPSIKKTTLRFGSCLRNQQSESLNNKIVKSIKKTKTFYCCNNHEQKAFIVHNLTTTILFIFFKIWYVCLADLFYILSVLSLLLNFLGVVYGKLIFFSLLGFSFSCFICDCYIVITCYLKLVAYHLKTEAVSF
jgi:hypothetical protein